MELTINGSPQTLRSNELLIEVINRGDVKIPQVCYHPQLAPKQKQLHNLGAFELLRGALSVSDKLIETTVDFAVRNCAGASLSSPSSRRLSGIKSSCAEVATRHGSTARRSRWR
jgi:hypothetical protein